MKLLVKRQKKIGKKRGCLKSMRQPLFIRVGDGNNFRLSDSQSVHFSFKTTSNDIFEKRNIFIKQLVVLSVAAPLHFL